MSRVLILSYTYQSATHWPSPVRPSSVSAYFLRSPFHLLNQFTSFQDTWYKYCSVINNNIISTVPSQRRLGFPTSPFTTDVAIKTPCKSHSTETFYFSIP
jgi:hypothetical protein